VDDNPASAGVRVCQLEPGNTAAAADERYANKTPAIVAPRNARIIFRVLRI